MRRIIQAGLILGPIFSFGYASLISLIAPGIVIYSMAVQITIPRIADDFKFKLTASRGKNDILVKIEKGDVIRRTMRIMTDRTRCVVIQMLIML